MDIQTLLTSALDAQRSKEFANSDQLSLGEIISKCEALTPKFTNPPEVIFEFEHMYPTDLKSWRGLYSELALGFNHDGIPPILDQFIETLKSAIGETFTGYKGGNFTMSEKTPVWVANYGDSGNTAIVDVLDDMHQVILITRRMKD